MPFVLDTSVAVSWFFADEESAPGEAIFDRLDDDGAVVPALWPLEVANALLAGERRGRSLRAEIADIAEMIGALAIVLDGPSTSRTFGPVLEIAREHELSVYDASYLELAIRRALPLATFDRRLLAAAANAGVELITK